jgi:hypothetical protein
MHSLLENRSRRSTYSHRTQEVAEADAAISESRGLAAVVEPVTGPAAPTGRDVEFTGLTISRCRDGRIEEEWELVDTISLLQQVGALPEAATA